MNGSKWPVRYEIRVDSVLDDQWADWFGGLQLSSDGTQTVIIGLLPDQPALHGLLTKIRDLGLSLISVRRWTPAMPDTRRSNDTRSRSGTDRPGQAIRRSDPWPGGSRIGAQITARFHPARHIRVTPSPRVRSYGAW